MSPGCVPLAPRSRATATVWGTRNAADLVGVRLPWNGSRRALDETPSQESVMLLPLVVFVFEVIDVARHPC